MAFKWLILGNEYNSFKELISEKVKKKQKNPTQTQHKNEETFGFFASSFHCGASEEYWSDQLSVITPVTLFLIWFSFRLIKTGSIDCH